ncbi:MAG TPA: enoyl-CoA hydratase-related protein [Albidovulum sp.]|uniref:enoyl-CoA hydratase-related protein n=1 Tax=Albidovulum sp. TaxID=1872424 RepID=UPI002D0111A9|nr:enoyl-CoA hydratase-related protein [Albidovulum sp.]
MSEKPVLVETTGGLTVITLNRPEVMNALNSAMRRALTEALTEAARSSRVIVLTGAGRAFCSGQDLADGGNAADIDLEATLRDEYEPMLKAIYDAPVPVLAAVNGAAAGAGANLALAADVVIAAESATFVQAFSRIGLIPDAGGTYWLPRQIGFPRAMGAALFAGKVMARQAAEWGMIWDCVADEAFDGHWRALAGQLAEGPTVAYRNLKRALRESYANDLDAQLALEAKLQADCGKSRDFREGVTAFLQKRPAKFEGR